MPIPIGAIPAISQAADNVGNAMLQNIGNMQSQRWSERMYQRQFDDNIRFWQMQNEYNSPEMQMQRFRAAKLNPNLIYGQGDNGNAGLLRAPDVQKPSFDFTPNTGIADAARSGLQYMMDKETRDLQNDNLKVQNEIMIQDAALRKAQVSSTLIGTERKKFDLDFERSLQDISMDYRAERLRQLKTGNDINIQRNAREAGKFRLDTNLALQRNARESAVVSQSLDESLQRMAESMQRVAQSKDEQERIRASADLLRKDGTIRQLEIELRQDGLNPNDPSWQTMVAKFLQYWAEDRLDKPKGSSLLKWLMNN